jgi:23S rRNA (cytidine1920-2'-O)/16S rRNA (cytidine1409-2'-O)-methyltransferase
VRRGLAPSRTVAQQLVSAGGVLVGGSVAERPARLVSPGEPIVLRDGPPRFAGRGGEKLDAALEHFSVDVAARVALDAGASTGGFTDCLLQRGACRVVAVDVGRGQLHERRRAEPRVVSLERTDIRAPHLADRPEAPFPIVVADLSFISLVTTAAALLRLAAPGADMVLLVKPQFEAGRRAASKGRGVIRDPERWRDAVLRVGTAMEAEGAAMMGAMVSPIRGAAGNVEFLAHLRAHRVPAAGSLAERTGVDALVTAAASRGDGDGATW